MQYDLPFEGASRLGETHRHLKGAFGPPLPTLRLDPLSQLLRSLLGARTRDAVSGEVFATLANHHSRWEELLQIPHENLFALIRDVTHAERKAVFIPLALRGIIDRRRSLDLDFLSAWPVDDGLAWLQALRGVGPKTAAAVLNFSALHQRALVVDTHYWRVARRLGLISLKTSLAKSSYSLARQIPVSWNADDTEENFILMKELGQTLCHHGVPECPRCPLRPMCPHPGSTHGRPA
jgi:endonuclease III